MQQVLSLPVYHLYAQWFYVKIYSNTCSITFVASKSSPSWEHLDFILKKQHELGNQFFIFHIYWPVF